MLCVKMADVVKPNQTELAKPNPFLIKPKQTKPNQPNPHQTEEIPTKPNQTETKPNEMKPNVTKGAIPNQRQWTNQTTETNPEQID